MNTKSAIVTGASRGIGLAIAEALISEGYTVYSLARTTGNSRAIHIECDLTDRQSVENEIGRASCRERV